MTSDLSSIAKDTLRDCAKYVLFDKSGAVLAANYQVLHLLLCVACCSACPALCMHSQADAGTFVWCAAATTSRATVTFKSAG